MSLFEDYSFLYEDTEFTPEERAEIGEFAATAIKCASDGDAPGFERAFGRHFIYVDDATMRKIGRVLLYFANHGEGPVKTAANRHFVEPAKPALDELEGLSKEAQGSFLGRLGSILKGVGGQVGGGARGALEMAPTLISTLAAAAVAAPVIQGAIDSVRQSSNLKRSLTQILQRHPELRDDPNTGQHFQALATFAPTLAENPLVAGQLMKRLHESPGLLTPETIRSWLGVQSGLATSAQPMQNQVNTLANVMMGLARNVEEGRKQEGAGRTAGQVADIWKAMKARQAARGGRP